LFAKNTGDGYADATQYEAYSYFFNLSKRINDKHIIAFSVFGAPQWHNQRSYQITYENYQKYGLRYNDNWGYKDGQVFNVKKNFYHKPEAVLNHFWNINENTQVNTALYASIGTGGGSGASSSIEDRTNDGLIDFTKIVNTNIALGNQGSGNIIRNSNNDHVWYGIISTIKHTIGKLNLSGGIDGRSYVGKHYQTVSDLLGGQFYIDKITSSNGNYNDPNKSVGLNDKLGYNNDGVVRWYGAFGQAEYTMDKLTVFVAGSVSDKWYQRIDHFRYFSDDVIAKINSDATVKSNYIASIGQSNFDRAMKGQKSKVADIIGYGFKGGANFNITNASNFYINSGYFERQPDFNTVFPNNLNYKNKNSKNEKVLSFELGYGYRSRFLTANVNLYNTSWNDKTLLRSTTVNNVTYYANIQGVDALHKGIELDFVATPIKNLSINGMASLGDWTWTKNIDSLRIYDENQSPVGNPINLKLKNVHVGNAAQTVVGIGADYNLMKGFTLGANYTYFDRLYAYFDPTSYTTEGDVWKMPSFGLLDMNMVYNFSMNNLNSSLFINVHNLLNTQYFSDGTDAGTSELSASDPSAKIFFGLGTTWSIGLKVKF
jgi:hypothetical protein